MTDWINDWANKEAQRILQKIVFNRYRKDINFDSINLIAEALRKVERKGAETMNTVECGCNVDWTPQEIYDLRAENEALTKERDRMLEIIKKLMNQTNKGFLDHACVKCVPNGTSVVSGFLCGIHSAEALSGSGDNEI